MLRIILSAIGIVLTSNLYLNTSKNSGLCSGDSACQAVLSSLYSTFLGIQVSVIGLAFFVMVLVISLKKLMNKEERENEVVTFLSIPAAIASLYYIVIQALVIDSFCWVCNITHVLVFALAAIAVLEIKNKKVSSSDLTNYQAFILPVSLLVAPILFYVLFANGSVTNDNIILKGKNGFLAKLSDVDKPIATQLFDLESKIYTLRQSTIKGLILKNEAEIQGKELQTYLNDQITSKIVVSTKQINDFKKKFGSRIPKSWTDDNIKQYIKSQQSQSGQERLVSNLISTGDYKVLLNKPEQKAVEVLKNPNGSLTTGDTVAPIQIVEFSDIQCPYCSRAHESLKSLQSKFKGKINVTFRHFPLSFHKEAEPAARAVVCAQKENKAWDLLDVLFANQKSLSLETIKESAYKVGVNKDSFETCLNSKYAKETVQFDMAEANRLGINSTPTLIINGKIHKGLPTESLIRELLN